MTHSLRSSTISWKISPRATPCPTHGGPIAAPRAATNGTNEGNLKPRERRRALLYGRGDRSAGMPIPPSSGSSPTTKHAIENHHADEPARGPRAPRRHPHEGRARGRRARRPVALRPDLRDRVPARHEPVLELSARRRGHDPHGLELLHPRRVALASRHDEGHQPARRRQHPLLRRDPRPRDPRQAARSDLRDELASLRPLARRRLRSASRLRRAARLGASAFEACSGRWLPRCSARR